MLQMGHQNVIHASSSILEYPGKRIMYDESMQMVKRVVKVVKVMDNVRSDENLKSFSLGKRRSHENRQAVRGGDMIAYRVSTNQTAIFAHRDTDSTSPHRHVVTGP